MTAAWAPGRGDCAAPKSISALGRGAVLAVGTFGKTGNRFTQTAPFSAGDTANSFTYPATGQPQPHTVSKVDTTGPNGTSQDKFGYDADGNRLIAREPSAPRSTCSARRSVWRRTPRPRRGPATTATTATVAQRNSISGLKWLLSDHQGRVKRTV